MINAVLTFVRWLLYGLSLLAGLVVAMWAFILVSAVNPPDKRWLLRVSGVCLVLVCAVYWLPIRQCASARQLALIGLITLASAFAYGVFYNLAELDDPFRSENELGAAHPFETAAGMCALPILRLLFASVSLKLRMPNQSSDPTLASGTPPAGQEPRPR